MLCFSHSLEKDNENQRFKLTRRQLMHRIHKLIKEPKMNIVIYMSKERIYSKRQIINKLTKNSSAQMRTQADEPLQTNTTNNRQAKTLINY